MGEKTCSKCQACKPLSEFNRKRNGLQPWCRDCMKAHCRAHYQANRAPYIARAKAGKAHLRAVSNGAKNRPCADCGVAYPPYVMQFDHLDASTKVMDVASMVSLGVATRRVLAEIDKCEVVCANCHAIRTHMRRQETRAAA